MPEAHDSFRYQKQLCYNLTEVDELMQTPGRGVDATIRKPSKYFSISLCSTIGGLYTIALKAYIIQRASCRVMIQLLFQESIILTAFAIDLAESGMSTPRSSQV